MPKTLIISGGSEGLGFAIAKRMVASYNVYILSNNEDKLKNAASEINCKYKVCDVTDYNRIKTVVEEIKNESGSIDVCINNAGIWIQGELENNEHELIKKVLEINTLGVIYLTKSVIPYMKSQNSGSILNVVSQAGLYPKSEASVYRASKWAITGFTKCLYQELAKYNIKVMGVFPSVINTKLFENAGYNRDMANALEVEDVAKSVEFMINWDNSTTIPELGISNIHYN